MTRINVVPVAELCDQHLLAEHRELTRIPNGIISGKLKINYPDRPADYVLGAGHVKFFTNKLWFLYRRYRQLESECYKRGFNVKDNWPGPPVSGASSGCWSYYEPTEQALFLNRKRIAERMPKNPRFTTKGGSK